MGSLELDLSLRIGRADLRVELATSARAIGIVGPSGAGKSTLLRVLAGLDRRAMGAVRFGGEVWQDASTFRPPWERGVGWVPQDGVLFPHLSVAENVAYAARIPIEPVAGLLGVEHLLGRQPRNLSGGERQRVALGRALCAAPRLLLLDEPFAALDKPLRTHLSGALSSYLSARSIPLVLVTHDEADLAALVEEAWEIREGRLVRL